MANFSSEQLLLRAAGALLAYGIDPLADAFSIDPAKAVASARAAAAALGRAPGDTTAASAATSRPAPVDPMEAARLAAAQIARQLGASTGESAATAAPSAGGATTTEADRAAAAAAFAASLTGHKRSRWGEGSTQLVAVGDGGGTGGASSAASKSQQALVVSQLSDKLAAFRKDRGVDDPSATGRKLSLKLFVPDQLPGQRERNWVGIIIGRDGVNKKRFEEETGATIYLRGEGTTLRGGPPGAQRGGKGGKGGGGGGRADADDDTEAMHVLLEADTQEALDTARKRIVELFNPKRDSTALTLFDSAQITSAALEKTTRTEECAFCGKPGHHHSKCPQRKTTFQMTSIICSACGSSGHTAKDCKGGRSNVASLVPKGFNAQPSLLDDDDFAAFDAELRRRG